MCLLCLKCLSGAGLPNAAKMHGCSAKNIAPGSCLSLPAILPRAIWFMMAKKN
jgi:hypothetical protein